jgi:hypothetical protein
MFFFAFGGISLLRLRPRGLFFISGCFPFISYPLLVSLGPSLELCLLIFKWGIVVLRPFCDNLFDVLFHDAKREFGNNFFLVCVRVNENIMEITFKFKIIWIPFQEMHGNVDHCIGVQD